MSHLPGQGLLLATQGVSKWAGGKFITNTRRQFIIHHVAHCPNAFPSDGNFCELRVNQTILGGRKLIN